MKFIPISGPWITQKEIDYVTDAVSRAWFSNSNMYHERFEKSFADYLGVKYAMCLPSCTSAIHLSLLALEVGPGDEVIVPEITWIASSAPITYVGATPIFADIDPVSWCLSAESFEKCITPKTKAVISVDLYGNMPNMDAITEIAQRNGIAIIEDAAEAIGSEYKKKKAGSLGDTGVFSFHGSKTLTTGEGGLLVTNREDIYHRAQFLRDHGRKPGDKTFNNTEVAYKYKMSALQAALGLAQLERVEELIARKRDIFSWYENELKGYSNVTLNNEGREIKNTYWMVSAIFHDSFPIEKYPLITWMKEKNIDCRPFFNPLSSLPAYENSQHSIKAQQQNVVSYKIASHGINFPSGLNLTQEQVKYICDTLKEI